MAFQEWIRLSKIKVEDMKRYPEKYKGQHVKTKIRLLEAEIRKAEKWLKTCESEEKHESKII